MFNVATCGTTSRREVGFQDEEQLRSSFDTFSNEIAVKNGGMKTATVKEKTFFEARLFLAVVQVKA